MNSISFIYAGFTHTHAFDKVFSSKSAFYRTLVWASSIKNCSRTVIAVTKETESEVRSCLKDFSLDSRVIVKDSWNTFELLDSMVRECTSYGADSVIYASGDKPFLDDSLTEKLQQCHREYIAEYTFQDGYPYGFAPEIIDAGALKIIFALCEKSEERNKAPSNEGIFNIMKADINSFDIETVMAEADYRLLRLDFSCDSLSGLTACKRLYEKALDEKVPFNASALTVLSTKSAEIQQTVPGFYNIQLTTGCSSFTVYNPYGESFKNKYGQLPVPECSKNVIMSLESFNAVVREISDFSEKAVVGLSAFGESLLLENFADYAEAVLMYPGLSVLIETDGLLISDSLIEKIRRMDKANRVMWIVSIDAFTEEKYNQLHAINLKEYGNEADGKSSAFKKACDSVAKLCAAFPGNAYPQFVRMKENEGELEKFYRYWHNPSSPSKGQLIIQKYDSYCGVLPDCKSADLSPLARNTCWHLKRDFTILADGSVPFCREELISSSAGNVFEEGIEKIWKKFMPLVQEQIDLNYSEKCRKCDEYYTFNF